MGDGYAGITRYETLDMDSQSNVIIGGSTTDTSIVTLGSDTQLPIAAYISYSGGYNWAKAFITGYASNSILAIKFNPLGTYLVVVFESVTEDFSLLNAADGSIITSYTKSP
jgi:hypothetical protein